jgi:hypothetical protein
VAAAPPAGRESPFFARFVLEPAAALPAGCKFAIFARGTFLGCATCFAARAYAAGFNFSPRIATSRRATSFDELCEDAGCADVDDTSREETTATPSLI